MVISNLMGFSHLLFTLQSYYFRGGIYRLSGDVLSLLCWLADTTEAGKSQEPRRFGIFSETSSQQLIVRYSKN